MTRDDVEAFMADQLARLRATSAAVRFRALRRFYNWMVAEEILAVSPMAKMTQPQVPEQPVPILTESELAALLRPRPQRKARHRRRVVPVGQALARPRRAGLVRPARSREDRVTLPVDHGWAARANAKAAHVSRPARLRPSR